MAEPDDTWAAYLQVAKSLHPTALVPTPLGPIAGRFIKILVHRLVIFWGRHKATLIPYLTQLAIAAVESLVANASAFDNVNPPGPD